MNYSVLMSVYYKVNHIHLEKAIQSMLHQTYPTNDFVIVCDGQLTDKQNDVLNSFVRKSPEIFQIIRLAENVGIGAAMSIGLASCKNELVAKMDADDIAIFDRCEKQLKRFIEEPRLTVLGGFISEFIVDSDEPYAIRAVPVDNEGIRQFAKRRQPFNNVTVMFRKSSVEAVGGYRPLRRNEDFDLYIRLLNEGYYCENLPIILVYVRSDESAMKRRGSLATLYGMVQSRWYAYRLGYSSIIDFVVCIGAQVFLTVSPVWLRKKIYEKVLRKKIDCK